VGSPVGGQDLWWEGFNLWNRCVLSLEWKRDEVMNGELAVTDDEQQARIFIFI